jgi:5-formyltetrahydrofolate cyclo-ligase
VSGIEVALLPGGRAGRPEHRHRHDRSPLEVLDESMPETEHSFSVDLIVTPDKVIACEPSQRPNGLCWNNHTPAKIRTLVRPGSVS